VPRHTRCWSCLVVLASPSNWRSRVRIPHSARAHLRSWPNGPGTCLPSRTCGFDSRRSLKPGSEQVHTSRIQPSSPWGCSSPGRASRSHREGSGFESRLLHTRKGKPIGDGTALEARRGAGPCRFTPVPSATEVVRLVEDTVSKTAGGRKVSRGFESLRLRTVTPGVAAAHRSLEPAGRGSNPRGSAMDGLAVPPARPTVLRSRLG
jgi:hypothetical protein